MTSFNKIYEDQIKSTGKIFTDFLWQDKDHYVHWLAQTYYFVKNSMQLLSLTAAHFSPKETEYQNRFIAHAGEEKGHERLLLNDLRQLDFKIEDITELPETAGFYQSQYYWIQHVSPYAFFGYLTILEGLAANFGTRAYELVEKKWGSRAGAFLKVHGNEDTDHIQKALEKINKLDGQKMQLVIDNFKMSSNMYGGILLAINRHLTQKNSLVKKSA